MSQYGQPPGQYPPPYGYPGAYPPHPPQRRGMPWWGWMLIILGGGSLLCCGGTITFLAYVGHKGPDTKVYTANEVPQRFVDIIDELELLEEGERIRYFYSPAFLDIRNEFYFVSDRKVAMYLQGSAAGATTVPFERIRSAELERNESFFDDSIITLTLQDGEILSFPVSSEQNRDQQVHQAIENQLAPPRQ